MTNDEMRRILEDILEAQHEFLKFHSDQPEVLSQLSAPASPQQLTRLDAFIGRRKLKLPPSYRQFLSVSNGIQIFRIQTRFALRSVEEIIAAETDDEGWDELSEDFDDVGPVHHFIIGGGDAIVVCGFDPSTVDDRGEMKVIEFDVEMNDPNEHDDFEAFLRAELQNYQDDVAQAVQDRAALKDD